MKLTFVQCSGCGDQAAHIRGEGPKIHAQVREMAERVGWEFRSEGDYCPECRVRKWPVNFR